ncbi:MAG: serine hydroxymethyltransferase [Pelagibacterales bacterium]|nr:serine hydroxymethyltransferase [Pelagibacterales bacterium]PPR15266.1 MAG: Serine hydroxymethyltransferase [Alphaproteobacteria bacterium MarineAlpha9_Bin3]|tara:strand:+ start:4957 stop:6270 length:1314 start_codon:yes stop_codon:yes gene_type:complete
MSTINNSDFFNSSSTDVNESFEDQELLSAMQNELYRQQNSIELIASENFVSKSVLNIQGSVLTNKYAEGYPGKRYYGGCEFVDHAEDLAIKRACKLFSCQWANVQPNSGSQANQAVFMALLNPGDTILGMSLAAGGHLTHGAKPNQSGKWFKSIQYGVNKDDGIIDYYGLEKLAIEEKPKLIIAGASAYSRHIDFEKIRIIADKVGAYFLADIAHYSGLIAAGEYPNPIEYAHVVTTTTHKTLRGPRGGMILSNDLELGKLFDKAIFPGIQGGPLMHVIAAKAAAFGEALKPDFKEYIKQIIINAKVLANELENQGLKIVSGGTDSHVILCDLRPFNITGKTSEESLDRAGITCNKNAVPFDTQKPFITSGLRIGTPAITTRGFKEKEMVKIGKLIGKILKAIAQNDDNISLVESEVKKQVISLCKEFPLYSSLSYN